MHNKQASLKGHLFLAGYIALIYSTLSLAPRISNLFSSALGRRNFDALVTGGIAITVLSCMSACYRRLSSRTVYFYAWLAALLGAYAFMLTRWTNLVAEKLHLIEYGFLSILVLRVVARVRNTILRYACVIAIVGIIGYGDELIQKFLPNRVYDIKDVALNVISGILGLIFFELLNSGDGA